MKKSNECTNCQGHPRPRSSRSRLIRAVIMARIRYMRCVYMEVVVCVLLLAAQSSAFLMRPAVRNVVWAERTSGDVRSDAPVEPLRGAVLRISSAVKMQSSRQSGDNERTAAELTSGRGAFLKAAAATVAGAGAMAVAGGAVVAAPRRAEAATIGGLPIPFTGGTSRPEQTQVLEVAQYSLVVNKVEQDLRAGALKGGPDDSVVVIRVLETFLNPMLKTMISVAPVLKLTGRENLERVKLLPLLMKGHLAELKEACRTENAKDQLREMQEVKETLDEFLALAKTQYEVVAAAPLSPEGDQLGIFGCTFYGLSRVDGTSTCQDDSS